MGVISSLSVAVETLKRNPVLFVAGLVIALVNGVVAGGQMLSSGSGVLLWSLGSFAVQLGSLFVVAGAYGMVVEALDGTTRLGTLLSEGKHNFADALAATILLVVAMVAAFVFVGFVAFIAALVVLTSDIGGLSPGYLTLALGVVYLLGLLPMFFLQFYLPAVVVSDRSPVDALKQSYRLVRRNLGSTLGFDAVIAAVMVAGSLPTIWLFATRADSMAMGATASATYPFAGLSPTTVWTYVAATVVLGTVTGTFFYVYQVAFYEECLPAGGDEAPESKATDGAV